MQTPATMPAGRLRLREMITIRPERSADRTAVRGLDEAAFEGTDEADLVDRLREEAVRYLALVAVVDGEVVGHIAFSPVTLDPLRPDLDLRGLAPMAVLPAHQRTGIGTALVRDGLEACRRAGAQAVVVLGHPDYYPRFGFRRADTFGLRTEYEAPPEAFMALELVPGSLAGIDGLVRYHPAFGS